MRTLPLLLLALAVAACGEPAADTPSGGESPSPERVAPLGVGDVAPAFPGLPEGGTTVVVFYRGPW